ncbi:MAG: hypothetical protein ACPIOQ_42875, partial [Promethearchaeia archaeon]
KPTSAREGPQLARVRAEGGGKGEDIVGMDFSGLNSNPVVFDTSANVRQARALDDEDDEVWDEVVRLLSRTAGRVARVERPARESRRPRACSRTVTIS